MANERRFARYVYSPAIIEAYQWLPDQPDACEAMRTWLLAHDEELQVVTLGSEDVLRITVPYGSDAVRPGWWVTFNLHQSGRKFFDIHEPDDFDRWYEPVED